MLSSDVTIFDESINHLEHSKPFSGKSMLYQTDQNNNNYSGQIQIDCSSLSNSGKWLDYKNAYIEIPYVVSMKGSTDISAAVNAFSVGLKNGYYQIIESMSVDLNQRNIVQLQNNLNILTNYRVLTSFSQDDLVKYGPILGIYPDTANSYRFSAAASLNGDGYSNNITTPFSVTLTNTSTSTVDSTVTPVTVATTTTTNIGITTPPANTGAYNRLLTTTALDSSTVIVENAADLGKEGRSYYVVTNGTTATDNVYNWLIIATIRLKDICPFFEQVPIMKTANYRFIINYNSSETKLSVVPNSGNPLAATVSVTSVSQLSGQTNPIFFPSIAPNSVNAAFARLATTTTLTISCNVAKNNLNTTLASQFATCRLYVPAYELQPEYELNLIESMPRTKIEYNDYFVYRVTNIGQTFNALLTNGIVNPKAIVIIPFANQGSSKSVNTQDLPQYQMPFDSCPSTSCPNASISAFNIQCGGSNIFNLDEQYQFSNFLDEFTHINALSGSQITGLNSGLIGQYQWLNAYRFYVADLSRRLRPEDKLAKSILIRGTNNTRVDLDLLVFVLYERHVNINLVSGEITE